jgi:hypothetical protein
VTYSSSVWHSWLPTYTKKHGTKFSSRQLVTWVCDNYETWITTISYIFRRVRKIAKIGYWLLDIFRPYLRPLGTTRLPLYVFACYLICEYFSKICPVNSSLIKIWQQYRVLWMNTFVPISRWMLPRMRNISDKVVEKIKTHFIFSNFFRKMMPFMR